MVVELLIAVQVYVLLTPVVSDGLVDDRTSVSSPSDEVTACVAGGATWALAAAAQTANNTVAMGREKIRLADTVNRVIRSVLLLFANRCYR
jgi:hypothetical protein